MITAHFVLILFWQPTLCKCAPPKKGNRGPSTTTVFFSQVVRFATVFKASVTIKAVLVLLKKQTDWTVRKILFELLFLELLYIST